MSAPGSAAFSKDNRYLYEIPYIAPPKSICILDTATNSISEYNLSKICESHFPGWIVPILGDYSWAISIDSSREISDSVLVLKGSKCINSYSSIFKAMEGEMEHFVERNMDHFVSWEWAYFDNRFYIIEDVNTAEFIHTTTAVSIYDGRKWSVLSVEKGFQAYSFAYANCSLYLVAFFEDPKNCISIPKVIDLISGNEYWIDQEGYIGSAWPGDQTIYFIFFRQSLKNRNISGPVYHDYILTRMNLVTKAIDSFQFANVAGWFIPINDEELFIASTDGIYIHKIAGWAQHQLESKKIGGLNGHSLNCIMNDKGLLYFAHYGGKLYSANENEVKYLGKYRRFIDYYRKQRMK